MSDPATRRSVTSAVNAKLTSNGFARAGAGCLLGDSIVFFISTPSIAIVGKRLIKHQL
jgi:hypothetical protein